MLMNFRLPVAAVSSTFCLLLLLSVLPLNLQGGEQLLPGSITQRPMKKLTFDPNAEQKELFAAIEEGTVEYKMVMQNSKEGVLLLENKTQAPISLELPHSIVGVQIFPQFGAAGGGTFGATGGAGGAGGAGGGQQAVGGGMGGGMAGGGTGMGMGGGGFFSIPAEKAVAVPIHSVCLEYGKREPSSRSTYMLMKPEDYTQDKTLQELIGLVAQGRIDRDVAQAAAWHVSSKLSWQDLATKTVNNFGAAGPRSMFSPAHIAAAQNLVSLAVAKARAEKTEEPQETPVPARVSRTTRN